MSSVSSISVQGYKSIRELNDLPLTNLNVLIGANGAGKSNFIGLFRLLTEMLEQRLQLYVPLQGGADALLHFGRKTTERLSAGFKFNNDNPQYKKTFHGPQAAQKITQEVIERECQHFKGWMDSLRKLEAP